MIRIHKILSKNTFYSLREIENIILEGRIKVNDNVITKLGTSIDVNKDTILLDNVKINFFLKKKDIFLCFYKPKNVICSKKDDFGRLTIFDILKSSKLAYENLQIIGRLDYKTEGVILLTNNKQKIDFFSHPSNKIKKVYLVKIRGVFNFDKLLKINKYFSNYNNFINIEFFKKHKKSNYIYWLKVNLYSGENNFIKRLFWKVNCYVLKILRISYAGVYLKNMKPGTFKIINEREIYN